MSDSLSDEQLSKESGIPKEIIELIRATVHPETMFVAITGADSSGRPDPIGSSTQSGLLSEDEKRNYDEILKNYPELKSIIEAEIQMYSRGNERLATSVIGRHHLDKEKKRNAKFKGLGFRFMLREPETSNDDDRFAKLIKDLDERSCQIQNIQNSVDGYRFKTLAEATTFLINSGSTATPTSIVEEPARGFEIKPNQTVYDSIMKHAQLMADTGITSGHAPPGHDLHLKIGLAQRIPPGSKVKRVSDGVFSVESPECYTARLYKKLAYVSVVKNKFELVKRMGTNAPNYNITNEMVLDQLKRWDKKYGIKVLSAEEDKMSIEIKNLPADLSEFCTESFLFCGELDMTGDDENMNAAIMRAMAARIRQTKTMSFWWD